MAETVLDESGAATVTWPSGSYTVQVFLDYGKPGCFWGTTLDEVTFPR